VSRAGRAVAAALAWTCLAPGALARRGPPPRTLVQAARHVRTEGRRFVLPDGRPFQWRGVTAFRLLERLASGHEAEADRYLEWAAGEGLTVVRVLAMARDLFELPPARGRAHLDRLLDLAAARGLHVEVVALADTAADPTSLETQVAAVGVVCARHGNAFLELANEPDHPTERPALADPATLVALRRLVPAGVPVAVGATSSLPALAAGDYVTLHAPRGAEDPWSSVWSVVDASLHVSSLGKPVVSDEPIGAAEWAVPGQRDNDPARFRAMALTDRFLGVGATFHYEGGLNALVPEGREAACFRAWLNAWTALSGDFELRARFVGSPGADSPVALDTGGRGRALEVREDGVTWILLVGAAGAPKAAWRDGWRAAGIRVWPGVWLAHAERVGEPGA
jgi:hypothetical protein